MTVQSLTEDRSHFLRPNETGWSLFFSVPQSFSIPPPTLFFLIQMHTFVMSECDGAFCASQSFSVPFPLLSSAEVWGWLLSVVIECLYTVRVSVKSHTITLWIIVNKGSSLHEKWAAWLGLYVKSKQYFSTTDSTLPHSSRLMFGSGCSGCVCSLVQWMKPLHYC